MNEENVNKKEKKSKRKLIMILIIILFVLLISSSITYYFLVYTDNDKNIAEKITKVNSITFYDVDKEIKKYNKYINNPKSIGKNKNDEPGEIRVSGISDIDDTNSTNALVYIDKNKKMVFKNKKTNEKYFAQGIEEPVLEYHISLIGLESFYASIIVLTEDGKLYEWTDSEAESNNFMFTLVVDDSEKIKGIVTGNNGSISLSLDEGSVGVGLSFYLAITDNGLKRIDWQEKKLTEDIKNISYKEVIFEEFNTEYLLIDNNKYITFIDKNEFYLENGDKLDSFGYVNVPIDEVINKYGFFFDENADKIKVNYLFEIYSGHDFIYFITDKGKIFSIFPTEYDEWGMITKEDIKLYNNKIVKSVKATYKYIKITYTDNSVEIFQTSTD